MTAGCAGIERARPGEQPYGGAKRDEVVAVKPPVVSAPPDEVVAVKPPLAEATRDQAIAVEPVARPPAPPAPESATPSIAPEPPVVQAPGKLAASPVPAAPIKKKESPAPVPVKPAPPASTAAAKPATPTLDLASLEKRLKETDAIGVFTKLTLKNQVNDLLDRFRACYAGRNKTTLAELRQPYDLLILKVLSLLQDSDPPLAAAIASSREAIWGILSDREKFANFKS